VIHFTLRAIPPQKVDAVCQKNGASEYNAAKYHQVSVSETDTNALNETTQATTKSDRSLAALEPENC